MPNNYFNDTFVNHFFSNIREPLLQESYDKVQKIIDKNQEEDESYLSNNIDSFIASMYILENLILPSLKNSKSKTDFKIFCNQRLMDLENIEYMTKTHIEEDDFTEFEQESEHRLNAYAKKAEDIKKNIFQSKPRVVPEVVKEKKVPEVVKEKKVPEVVKEKRRIVPVAVKESERTVNKFFSLNSQKEAFLKSYKTVRKDYGPIKDLFKPIRLLILKKEFTKISDIIESQMKDDTLYNDYFDFLKDYFETILSHLNGEDLKKEKNNEDLKELKKYLKILIHDWEKNVKKRVKISNDFPTIPQDPIQIKELKQFAKKQGIKNVDKMNYVQLLRAINSQKIQKNNKNKSKQTLAKNIFFLDPDVSSEDVKRILSDISGLNENNKSDFENLNSLRDLVNDLVQMNFSRKKEEDITKLKSLVSIAIFLLKHNLLKKWIHPDNYELFLRELVYSDPLMKILNQSGKNKEDLNSALKIVAKF